MTAYLAGLNDIKQIGRYRKPDGPTPTPQVELRLREGYKVVRMLLDCYGQAMTRNWLFGTNSRLDDQAPIGVLRNGKVPYCAIRPETALREVLADLRRNSDEVAHYLKTFGEEARADLPATAAAEATISLNG